MQGVKRRYINEQMVEEETYHQGQKSGTWRRWNDTGVLLREESYDDQAQKTGTWRQWNEAGVLQEEKVYKAGEPQTTSGSDTEQGKPGQVIVSDSKKPKQVSSVSADGKTRRVVGYDADGHKSREGVYRKTSGKLNKTIYSYRTVDGKSKYHGNTERYVDNRLQSEDLYVQGVKTSSTYCYERDSKRHMTWTPYIQVDGKSVKHGIAKRYLEGKLIEEIEYRDGKKVE